LVSRFLPLARDLARRYYSGGEPLDDLVQVASLGLVKAVERYDETRGVSFTSYAVPTITGELRRHFRDHVWPVHVPRGMQERALSVNKASRQASERTGRTPTACELSKRMGLTEPEVLDAQQAYAAFDTLSLDAPGPGGDDLEPRPRVETIGSVDGGYERVEDRLAIETAVRRLPVRERRALRMRFVEERTQTDIAARLGVSQMQVSRILRAVLGRLRQTLERSMPRARDQ
jgi:RNA polymerase sigma-B factor